MITTSFCLLVLMLAPWMTNGKPSVEKPVQPHFRDSRQLLLPYVGLPTYQPSFHNYGDPMAVMTPAAKRRLLQALLATSSALSSQSLDHFKFETALNQNNNKTSVDVNSKKQKFDAGTLLVKDFQNMGVPPEFWKQIEGRPSVEALVAKVVKYITTAVIQALISKIFG